MDYLIHDKYLPSPGRTEQLIQYSTSFYSFKVTFPNKGVYPYIQRIESSQNEFCIIDNSDIKK
jgi:hypothetical protein